MTKKLEELLELETITIAGQEYDFSLFKDGVNVDPTNLDYEFARHTKLVMIAGFAFEKAQSFAEALEVELKRKYAQLDFRTRQEAAISNTKITEKAIENAVITDSEYIELQNALLMVQEQLGYCKVIRDSMQHRKDCLVSLAANERATMQAEPSLRR